MNSIFRPRRALLAVALLIALTGVQAEERQALKVCADPNNLPFSNQAQQGFENRLAEILAEELELPLEYTWFPQRMGFIRNTLRAPNPEGEGYRCDLVIGLPAGYELAMTTGPYYRSTYALVVPRGKGLDEVHTLQDLADLAPEKLEGLRIGLFERSPAMPWLASHGLLEQVRALPALSGDPAEYPGQLLERQLAAGEIDVAILWGPVAGYFASRLEGMEVEVNPLATLPEARFDFAIAAGVRFGEREWRDTVQAALEKNQDRIEALLREYGVPLVGQGGLPLPTSARTGS